MASATASLPAARPGGAPRVGWRPPLGLVLLAVNLVVLALPIVLIAGFRLYETELVRATEADLGSQASLVAATFRVRLGEELDACGAGDAYGIAAAVPAPAPDDASFAPFEPRLSLATESILPPAPDPAPGEPAHPAAVAAGRWISPVLRDAQTRSLAGYRVVDVAGVVVASSREELGSSLAQREEVARALRGETASLLRKRFTEHEAPLPSISRSTRVRVFVALPVRDGDRLLGAVIASRTPVSVGKALYAKRVPVIAGAAAILLAVAAVTIASTLLIGRPLTALARQTEDVRRGGDGVVPLLRHPRTREAAQLSRAFHDLSRALADRTLAVRSFASAVSHELKNPLGAIRGSVELLRDHHATMAAEERERFLQHIDADAARMVRLVGKLLDLARAEAFRPGLETADAADVLAAPCARHGARLTIGAGPVVIRTAPEILAAVVTTLLENARQHAGAEATIDVRATGSGDAVTIDVIDDGPGIPPADRARVFEPHYTTARDTGGTGLGLTIAAALARAHGGMLALLPTSPGAAFRLTLPAA